MIGISIGDGTLWNQSSWKSFRTKSIQFHFNRVISNINTKRKVFFMYLSNQFSEFRLEWDFQFYFEYQENVLFFMPFMLSRIKKLHTFNSLWKLTNFCWIKFNFSKWYFMEYYLMCAKRWKISELIFDANDADGFLERHYFDGSHQIVLTHLSYVLLNQTCAFLRFVKNFGQFQRENLLQTKYLHFHSTPLE